MFLLPLAVLLDEHLVEGEPLRADLLFLRRGDDRASRLGEMRAVVELAASEERTELAHRLADLVLGQMEEAEGLEAGRVDDRRVLVEAVEAREGRRLRAGF